MDICVNDGSLHGSELDFLNSITPGDKGWAVGYFECPGLEPGNWIIQTESAKSRPRDEVPLESSLQFNLPLFML